MIEIKFWDVKNEAYIPPTEHKYGEKGWWNQEIYLLGDDGKTVYAYSTGDYYESCVQICESEVQAHIFFDGERIA